MFNEDAKKKNTISPHKYGIMAMQGPALMLFDRKASRRGARVHGTTVATMRSLSAGMILGTACFTSLAKAQYEL